MTLLYVLNFVKVKTVLYVLIFGTLLYVLNFSTLCDQILAKKKDLPLCPEIWYGQRTNSVEKKTLFYVLNLYGL